MFYRDSLSHRKPSGRQAICSSISQNAFLSLFKDADGPTLVGDPDLGFTGLRQFGPTLIHHSQLKYRESDLNFMLVSFLFEQYLQCAMYFSTTSLSHPGFHLLFSFTIQFFRQVDSPGMIDSPAGNQGTMDRGYDFPGVVGK